MMNQAQIGHVPQTVDAPLRVPVFVAYSLILWITFVVIIRTFAPMVAGAGHLPLVLSFLAFIPTAYFAVWTFGFLGAKGASLLPAVVITTVAPAILLDAVALT